MAKKFEIQNSTAEFLTFIAEGKENGVEDNYYEWRGAAYRLLPDFYARLEIVHDAF